MAGPSPKTHWVARPRLARQSLARQSLALCLLAALLALLASACQPEAPPAAPLSATASPTWTAAPTGTATPSLTASPTWTAAPSDTPTATATLPPPTATATLPPPTATLPPTPLPAVVASYPIHGDLAVPLTARMALALEREVDPQAVEVEFAFSPALEGQVVWLDAAHPSFEPAALITQTAYAMTATLRAAGGLGPTLTFTATFETGDRGAPIPILMYHRLRDLAADASQGQRDWSVAPASLEQQLDYLAERGYHTISLAQLVDYFEAQEPLPPRPVVISMDDGYRDVVEIAWPLLAKRGFIASLLVLPGYIEYSAYMDWEQMRALREAGYDFGSHSMTHPDLRSIPAAEAETEVRDSKALLEEHLGMPVVAFCYPMGAYNSATIALLQAQGYRAALTLASGYYQRADDDGLFRLKRTWVYYDMTLEQFADKLPW